eukprot:TRINITY_DN725_c0_g1_i2.p1 TRINITY_DN725_c0_g1~~TRINITY_DN725_c0_g1_i2.p1  ORF type:complete len:443 (-),score=105.48 TRINITY_DN725_c0_g1_i2:69-1397(-)
MSLVKDLPPEKEIPLFKNVSPTSKEMPLPKDLPPPLLSTSVPPKQDLGSSKEILSPKVMPPPLLSTSTPPKQDLGSSKEILSPKVMPPPLLSTSVPPKQDRLPRELWNSSHLTIGSKRSKSKKRLKKVKRPLEKKKTKKSTLKNRNKLARSAGSPEALEFASEEPSGLNESSPAIPVADTKIYKALYDYTPDDDDPIKLPLSEGNIIENVSESVNGWMEGTVNGRKGWFPESYVAPYQPEQSPEPSPEAKAEIPSPAVEAPQNSKPEVQNNNPVKSEIKRPNRVKSTGHLRSGALAKVTKPVSATLKPLSQQKLTEIEKTSRNAVQSLPIGPPSAKLDKYPPGLYGPPKEQLGQRSPLKASPRALISIYGSPEKIATDFKSLFPPGLRGPAKELLDILRAPNGPLSLVSDIDNSNADDLEVEVVADRVESAYVQEVSMDDVI